MTRFKLSPALLAAARVAAVTTVVAALLYGAAGVAIVGIAQRSLTDAVDSQLYDLLGFFQRNPARLVGAPAFATEPDPATFSTTFGWFFNAEGRLVTTTGSAPQLPTSLYQVTSPVSAKVGGTSLRLLGGPISRAPAGPGWLVLGESTHFIDQTVLSLLVAGGLAAIPFLALIFLIALAIGRLSSAPVEKARLRLVHFTADASHELRTPLQVIEAEVSLALQRERGAESYKGTIRRVQAESGRLRRLVDDLLWLARFDNQPLAPTADLVDLRAVASEAVERFEAVAASRGQSLVLAGGLEAPAPISAPAAWIERLAGVIVDNACRYSPEGGEVRVSVDVAGGRSRLVVDDTGPGIPVSERAAVFERFRRATEEAGGAGLGLAIGNAVIQGTGGRWEIGDAPSGGARVAVSWETPRRARSDSRVAPVPASGSSSEGSS